MTGNTPDSESQRAEAVVRDMLDRKSFPDDVEEEALELLRQGEARKAYEYLVKSTINKTGADR